MSVAWLTRPRGYKLSAETRLKMSLAKKGTSPSLLNRQITTERNRNKIWTKEERKKISVARTGKKFSPFTEEHKLKISLSNKKTYQSLSEDKKLQRKLRVLGEKNPMWDGGKTSEHKRLRHSVEYRNWRKSVFERDNYTCQNCGEKGGYLEADHIKPLVFFPELAFELSNGKTLCDPCHRKTDTYGHKVFTSYSFKSPQSDTLALLSRLDGLQKHITSVEGD